MDPSMQYQNQSQPYDPSSSSSAAAAYYPNHQYGNYQYYPQDYSNYQQHPYPEESSSVHPPGVPVDSHTQQYYSAYQQQQQQQHYDAATWQGGGPSTEPARPSQYDSTMWHNAGSVPEAGHFRPRLPVEPSYSGGGRRGGRGGGSSSRGRGRGRGRVGPVSRAPPQQSAAPPRMAWCELCRVDCNTAEILQKHLEGKKHKKALKMKEELERLDKIIVEREKEKVEEQIVTETSASRGRGGMPSKRKIRGGGRGSNKRIRASEGAKKPTDPPVLKQSAGAFVCQLCHVTCESQVVFDSHLKGKKHMANVLEQQTLLGHAALEAIYPALQAALQENYHLNPEGHDPQAVLTHLLTTLLANGQVGATLGAASTSTSVPPLVTENTNPESFSVLPEGRSQDVADNSQIKPESVNSEADVTVEKKVETVESETEKVDAPAVKP